MLHSAAVDALLAAAISACAAVLAACSASAAVADVFMMLMLLVSRATAVDEICYFHLVLSICEVTACALFSCF